MSHFSRKTLNALRERGISVVGITCLPCDGEMAFANGETGYTVNDNGTGKVWTFPQVMEAAR